MEEPEASEALVALDFKVLVEPKALDVEAAEVLLGLPTTIV